MCSDVNKDFSHKDQDQDKDFSYKDQDKDQDFGVKDKDKDQDLSRKDKDKDFGLTKQTSSTDTNTGPTTITNSLFIMPHGSTDKNTIIYTRQNVRDKIQNTHNNNKNTNDKYVSVSQMSQWMNAGSRRRRRCSGCTGAGSAPLYASFSNNY